MFDFTLPGLPGTPDLPKKQPDPDDFDADEWLQNTQDLGRLGLRALFWPADALASAREYERDSSLGNLIDLILSGLPILGFIGDIGKVVSKLSETVGNLLRKIPGVSWLVNKVDEFLNVPAAQRAWRGGVEYTKQLDLPDTGVRPGKMHTSITVNEEGRAVVDNRAVSVPEGITPPGVYYFDDPNLAAKYPSGVYIDQYGFPDYSPYSEINVTIDDMTGIDRVDFKSANEKAKFYGPGGEATQDSHKYLYLDYTWHHHQDGKTMMLIPTELNANVPHTGGAAVARWIKKSTPS